MTIGFQLASAVHVFLGLPYAELVGMIYVALASALACKVFRMVLLCETVVDDGGVGGGEMGTLGMGGAGMTLGTVQFARRSSVNEEDVGMGMGPVRTTRKVV